jgi:hypothetical protein
LLGAVGRILSIYATYTSLSSFGWGGLYLLPMRLSPVFQPFSGLLAVFADFRGSTAYPHRPAFHFQQSFCFFPDSFTVSTDILSIYTNSVSVSTDILSIYTNSVSVSTDILSVYTNSVSVSTDIISVYTNSVSVSTDILSVYTNSVPVQQIVFLLTDILSVE